MLARRPTPTITAMLMRTGQPSNSAVVDRQGAGVARHLRLLI